MIVIPMAGLSSRFTKAGFNKPKYMLEAKGSTLFTHSVASFKQYFEKERFLFIALTLPHVEDFIMNECRNLGIASYDIVLLSEPTRGQAETVYLGLKKTKFSVDEHITVFNIDTFRPGFKYPEDFSLKMVDGYLETFIGSGANWSNIVPAEPGSDKVKLTAEKREVSEFCCTGLYYFSSGRAFMDLFEEYISKDQGSLDGGEFYIAPMYNNLLSKGADIRFTVVSKDDVIFCGIPDEYYAFLKS